MVDIYNKERVHIKFHMYNQIYRVKNLAFNLN